MIPLLVALALQASAGQPGELRTFQDWTVGCDNGRACHAVALATYEDGGDGALTLSLRRGAAGAADPVVSIEAQRDLCGATLEADGQPLAARIIEAQSCSIVHPADVSALIDALRAGRHIRAIGADGDAIGTLSLAGAAAAMLHIDEAQGRLGTVTALVRRGAQGADAVPPPPAPPVVRAAPGTTEGAVQLDAARVRELRRRTGCTIDEVGGPDISDAIPLEAGKTLVLLSCGTGAYNLSSVPLIVRREGGRIAADVAAFDAPAGFQLEDGPPRLVNAEWDGADGLLLEFPRGRGLGDCGIRSRYAWDGARFRLVLREEMGECRGAYDFIRTWRARVERPEAP